MGDFIKRYLTEIEASGELPSWNDLKQFLKNRFAEITDSQHALAIMRKMRQNSNESVQIFAERILQVAEDAYTSENLDHEIIQKQLVDIFTDGLSFDFLRMKVLRENLKTLENAVQVAMREQNLRKRFALRSQDNGGDMSFNQNSTSTVGNNFLFKIPEIKLNNFRREEPMEINHFRNQRCHRCRKIGQRAKFCPFQVSANKSNPNQQRSRVHVREISNDLERKRCHLQCWHCEQNGHVRRNCPEMYQGRRPFRYQNACKPPYNSWRHSKQQEN